MEWCFGKHGISKQNDNGLWLLQLCSSKIITITNTLFLLLNRQKTFGRIGNLKTFKKTPDKQGFDTKTWKSSLEQKQMAWAGRKKLSNNRKEEAERPNRMTSENSSTSFIRPVCSRDCKARIRLCSHLRMHKSRGHLQH